LSVVVVSISSGLAVVVVVGSTAVADVSVFTSAGGVTVVSVVFGGLYQETALLICSSVYHFLSNSEYCGNSLTLAIISVGATVVVGVCCVIVGIVSNIAQAFVHQAAKLAAFLASSAFTLAICPASVAISLV
jgi:hypothetical protein